jgi:hypothetical protein
MPTFAGLFGMRTEAPFFNAAAPRYPTMVSSTVMKFPRSRIDLLASSSSKDNMLKLAEVNLSAIDVPEPVLCHKIALRHPPFAPLCVLPEILKDKEEYFIRIRVAQLANSCGFTIFSCQTKN